MSEATTKTKINKSDAIRKVLHKNGWDTPAPKVVAHLAKQGIAVNAALVNNVKSRENSRKASVEVSSRPENETWVAKEAGDPAPASRTNDSVGTFQIGQDPIVAGGHALAYIQAVGSIRAARKWLEAVERAVRE